MSLVTHRTQGTSEGLPPQLARPPQRVLGSASVGFSARTPWRPAQIGVEPHLELEAIAGVSIISADSSCHESYPHFVEGIGHLEVTFILLESGNPTLDARITLSSTPISCQSAQIFQENPGFLKRSSRLSEDFEICICMSFNFFLM